MPEDNEVSDRILYEPSDLWRTFRSLSVRSEKTILPNKVDTRPAALSDEEEDLLDVLAFTQPADPCRMTVQRKELRPHARRILASSECCNDYCLTLTDLGCLVRLLLSLQIDKTVRNATDQQASTVSINEDGGVSRRLVSAVLNRFDVQGQDRVEWQTFEDVITIYLVRLPFFQKNCPLCPGLTS